MADKVDVLAAMDLAVARAGGSQHAHLKQARAAVAELIRAANAYYTGYCVDEAEDEFDMSRRGKWTGCPTEQHEDAKCLRAALSNIGPQA